MFVVGNVIMSIIGPYSTECSTEDFPVHRTGCVAGRSYVISLSELIILLPNKRNSHSEVAEQAITMSYHALIPNPQTSERLENYIYV